MQNRAKDIKTMTRPQNGPRPKTEEPHINN